MSRIAKGMTVKHRASGELAVVTDITGDKATVSYDFGRKEATVDLAALEPEDDSDGPLQLEPHL